MRYRLPVQEKCLLSRVPEGQPHTPGVLEVISVATTSVADTRTVGRRLAGLLRPGDVILLVGELGSGKTALVSGLAEGLGVSELVTSPTFVIVKRYADGFIPLVHVDTYRLSTTGEFEDLDLLPTNADAVVAIEWGDSVVALVPDDHLKVALTVDDDGRRTIRFAPAGAWTERPLEELTQ